MDILRTISSRATLQRTAARKDQRRNAASGFVFPVDDVARLRRFLTLGTDGGTYYATARALTADNAAIVLRMAQSQPCALVDETVAISRAGRAPRQAPALFALAAAASLADDEGRARALAALPLVARTGTHLFAFAQYAQQFRGWGRALRRAVAEWYLAPPTEDVAYQAVKYRQREGWSHRDLLRLAHPRTREPERAALFGWVCGRPDERAPALVAAFDEARTATPARIVQLIERYPLTWEMLPDGALASRDVWAALLDKGMGMTALMRQLPRLTRLGVLTGELERVVAAQLADEHRLRRARVHPISVLLAQRTYALGRSLRGTSEWRPRRMIADALDAAFYASFGAIEPTGKRLLLALDVSGSMTWQISGLPISARAVAAALALATAKSEASYDIVGFTGGRARRRGGWAHDSGLSELAISPRQRLDDVMRATDSLPFGPTDCALPMLYARERGLEIDTFVIYTDCETWFGSVHPFQALRAYREASGIAARLVVVGLTSTGFSIADPHDAGMLDVAGFDAAVPQVISDFAAA